MGKYEDKWKSKLNPWRDENRRLRADAERLREERDAARKQHKLWKETSATLSDLRDGAEAKAERLREALERIVNTPNAKYASDIARTALDREGEE
jgi:predicted  nucleic acid-binding Zn-ribbon protein